MPRLFRPYIPLSVRVQVAERQVREAGLPLWPLYCSSIEAGQRMGDPWSLTRRLRVLLTAIFPQGGYQLDHDPALEQRPQRRVGLGRTKYVPDANSPDHLVYRSKAMHLMKTTGRKPDAEKTVTSKGSDVWIAKKFRKIEGKTKPRRKQKIASRPFQKGKRSFRRG